MLYKLLRDNQESGPYNKQELMNMEFLSSDFLRPDVEGSRWVLASKFTELKNKIDTNKPKPKYKITADGKLIEIKTQKDDGNTAKESFSETDGTEGIPFRRVPSALPKKKLPENEEPFNYTSKTELPPQAVMPPTGSRSASPKDTGKVMPEEDNKKRKLGNIIKEILIPVGILGAIFVGWKIYNNKTDNGSRQTKESVKAMVSEETRNKELATKEANEAATNTAVTEIPVPIPQPNSAFDDSIATLRQERLALRKKNDSIAYALGEKRRSDSLARITATTKANEKAAADKKAAEALAKEKALAAEKTKKETNTPAPAKAKKGAIRDYVRLALDNPAKKGYENAKIRVNNISNTNLDVAVVRVRYLDANSKLIKSETIQVDNIKAGRSVLVSIPDNKNADKISYGTTMISGDDIYIMQ